MPKATLGGPGSPPPKHLKLADFGKGRQLLIIDPSLDLVVPLHRRVCATQYIGIIAGKIAAPERFKKSPAVAMTPFRHLEPY